MNESEREANSKLAEKLFSEQDIGMAAIAGFFASIIAVFVHTVVVSRWPFAFGFATAGMGIIIGLAMQFAGRGIDVRFSVLAASFTIVACLATSLVAVSHHYQSSGNSALQVLSGHSVSWTAQRVFQQFSFVYCFVAVFAAVFLAKRPLSRTQRLAIGLRNMRHN